MASDIYSTVDTRTRSDQIRDRILALIREGHVKPGEQLPTQRELAQRFGVGMSSIREAVQSLVGLGALETRHGLGVFVRQLSLGDATRLLADAVNLTPDVSLQLLEARAMMEVDVARLAAVRHTSEDLDRMADAIDRGREYILQDDIENVIRADMEFHSAMVGAAHNEVAAMMLESISGLLRRDRLEGYRQGQGPGGVLVAHDDILAAIASGDPEAAAEQVEIHLDNVRQQVLRRMT